MFLCETMLFFPKEKKYKLELEGGQIFSQDWRWAWGSHGPTEAQALIRPREAGRSCGMAALLQRSCKYHGCGYDCRLHE